MGRSASGGRSGNGYTTATVAWAMREPYIKLALNFTDADGNPGVIQTECAPNVVDEGWAQLLALAADLSQKSE